MEREQLLDSFHRVRSVSVELSRPLSVDEQRVQSMPAVSPPWWNLAHTTWFFAKNILEPFGLSGEKDLSLDYALNSYYEAHGGRVEQSDRGRLSRPTVEEVHEYRKSVDSRIGQLVKISSAEDFGDIRQLIEIGLQHEQQHQELLITEIKHIRSINPSALREAYCEPAIPQENPDVSPAEFVHFEGGLIKVGNLEGGWCWDNELPVHQVYVHPFGMQNRLVTNREYLEFVEDGGYQQPLLWLSNGWSAVKNEGWDAPLYWERSGESWMCWTLAGLRPLELDAPVCHVSFYEADAYARWRSQLQEAGGSLRLPTEFEWECAARRSGFDAEDGNLWSVDFQPRAAAPGSGVRQLAGDVWEWTSSHYEPYPGYKPFGGSLMEYNGKFMDNQRVLRGGSCATPRSHIRASYRNFWTAGTRFQFSGIRLVRDL